MLPLTLEDASAKLSNFDKLVLVGGILNEILDLIFSFIK